MSKKHRLDRAMFIGCLIVAGEAVFSLPFHVARFFRPTVLQVFGFTNTELGAVQAVYGVVAMLAYFPGGLLADRFSPRVDCSPALCYARARAVSTSRRSRVSTAAGGSSPTGV